MRKQKGCPQGCLFFDRNNFDFQISQTLIGKSALCPIIPSITWNIDDGTLFTPPIEWTDIGMRCWVFVARSVVCISVEGKQMFVYSIYMKEVARYEIILFETKKKNQQQMMVSGKNTPKAEEMNFANIWTEAKRNKMIIWRVNMLMKFSAYQVLLLLISYFIFQAYFSFHVCSSDPLFWFEAP